MSKILITGNGFDLFHHLPTKYHHFISIMKTIENQNYDRMLLFEDIFGKSFKVDFPNDFNLIVENYNTDEIIFDFNKVNELSNLLNVNPWYKYFKNVLEVDTWIDFEIEIEVVLNQLSIFNKYDDKSIIRSNRFRDPLMKETDFDLFDLIKHQASSCFTINEKYINNRKGSIDVKGILADLISSFEEFILIFNRYLKDVVGNFYDATKSKVNLPFHLLDHIYTFNYTPTLERLYNIATLKITYLHGKLGEDTTQNLVLGVSELPEQIKNSRIFDFTKYYQKVKKNSNLKFIDLSKVAKSNLSQTVFYIMGHSLDESDKEYIFDLFEYLKLDKQKWSKICVFCYSEQDKESKLRNLFNIIDKDIILEMNKTGRLYFSSLTNENISKELEKELRVYKITFG
ncbi:conserved hypothetical protein [Flavobacterium sp. 9R]|uniref:AbiH family protein n=1 Tax=Flavobacterium sp. 9R TaxID=2653143 RepID=UPI0012F3FB10|nr:AbiH family protein [Flavobacterium sp. 9R]VXB36780.1 conserved hypothetical protein [Flavobacterium sp. 9R]